jgi:hypothetical protein
MLYNFGIQRLVGFYLNFWNFSLSNMCNRKFKPCDAGRTATSHARACVPTRPVAPLPFSASGPRRSRIPMSRTPRLRAPRSRAPEAAQVPMRQTPSPPLLRAPCIPCSRPPGRAARRLFLYVRYPWPGPPWHPAHCIESLTAYKKSRSLSSCAHTTTAHHCRPPWLFTCRAPSSAPPRNSLDLPHPHTHLSKLSDPQANTHWPLTRRSSRSCGCHHGASPSRLAGAITAPAPAAN